MIDFTEFLEFQTDRLILRQSEPSQAKQMLEYFEANREHFKLAMHDLPDDFYTMALQQQRLDVELKAALNGRGFRFYAYQKDDENHKEIVGDIGIFLINYYPAFNCEISFKVDEKFEGRGFMSEAVEAAILFVFFGLELHRIVAHTLPENNRSMDFLVKLGFKEEGISRQYLRFGGKWRDNLRFSLTKEDLNE